MRYLLHPEAENDLREAADYYKERAGAALSQVLLTEFEHAIQLLMQYPRLGTPDIRGRRRLLLRHFPYSVIYFVAGDEIRVLAVSHHSRRPGYWRKRTWQP